MPFRLFRDPRERGSRDMHLYCLSLRGGKLPFVKSKRILLKNWHNAAEIKGTTTPLPKVWKRFDKEAGNGFSAKQKSKPCVYASYLSNVDRFLYRYGAYFI